MAYDSVLINDIDNDWENANNWDGGVPATGETILIPEGDHVITEHVDQSGSVNDVTICVEEQFHGQIGTAAAPLKFGASSGSTLYYNGKRCQDFHVSCDLAAAYILDTHPDQASVSIEGGETTLLVVHGGQGLQLAASATCTTLIVDGRTAIVDIPTGNDIATLTILLGLAKMATSITATTGVINVMNGALELTGSSKTYAALNLYGSGALAELNCTGSTITLITAYAGVVDGRKSVVDDITITNATAYSGASLLYGKHIIETNAPTIYGATYSGYSAATIKTPQQAGPV